MLARPCISFAQHGTFEKAICMPSTAGLSQVSNFWLAACLVRRFQLQASSSAKMTSEICFLKPYVWSMKPGLKQ